MFYIFFNILIFKSGWFILLLDFQENRKKHPQERSMGRIAHTPPCIEPMPFGVKYSLGDFFCSAASKIDQNFFIAASTNRTLFVAASVVVLTTCDSRAISTSLQTLTIGSFKHLSHVSGKFKIDFVRKVAIGCIQAFRLAA